MLDIEKIRADFPILHQQVYGKPLTYLDNGATTQKPNQVIDAISNYYKTINSNVHRGVHVLSQRATDAEEASRRFVADFIGATHAHEIIFTRGTTESINLLAYSFGKKYLKSGDEVIVTSMEHHSNIVPWQMVCEERGAVLKFIPMNEAGELMLELLPELITERTKIIATTWVSNTLGTVNDVAKIIQIAHNKGVPVMLDAAQSIQHIPCDVNELDVDFLVFSGHKIYGPTGIGVLYGKEKFLAEIPPYQGGGSMIDRVTMQGSTYTDLPFKFEAGTPDIAGIVGLHAALKYVADIGLENIYHYEHLLLEYAVQELTENIYGLDIIGNPKERSGVLSFLVEGVHPSDLGELLDKQGVAVRTGHHCCQPIMDHFCIPGTVRASFSFYNTKEEVDRLKDAVIKAVQILY